MTRKVGENREREREMTCFEPSRHPLLRPVGAFRIPYLMEGNDFAVGSVGPEPLLVLSSPDEDMHQPAVTTENLLQLHSELLRAYHCVRAPRIQLLH